jgi:hypothetical protein
MINVEIRKKGDAGVIADITLPENVPGTFYWKGKAVPLRSGHQQITL